jgi:hypothetical protein
MSSTLVQKRLFSRGELKIVSGTATLDLTGADFTTYQPALTITPQADHALEDLRIAIDLAKAATGFSAQFTTQTIQFVISRKIDGTNWRRIKSTETAALSGNNAANTGALSGAMELFVGDVGPGQAVRVEVVLSSENGVSTVALPFVATYKAGEPATVA